MRILYDLISASPLEMRYFAVHSWQIGEWELYSCEIQFLFQKYVFFFGLCVCVRNGYNSFVQKIQPPPNPLSSYSGLAA